MAKVKTPSYYKEPSGRMDDAVFYCYRGNVYMRTYNKPYNPDTGKQRVVRKTFGDSVRSWQGLSPDEHHRYNIKAERLAMSGYNFYISTYMKQYLSYTDVKISSNSVRETQQYICATGTEALRCLSEASPLSCAYASESYNNGFIHSPDMR